MVVERGCVIVHERGSDDVRVVVFTPCVWGRYTILWEFVRETTCGTVGHVPDNPAIHYSIVSRFIEKYPTDING